MNSNTVKERQTGHLKVSVVIPVHNTGVEVKQVASQIERQKYRDFEILIVDDGSTDDTVKIAEQSAVGMGNIRVIRTKHGGAAHARNVGLQESKGDVVFFAEPDCVYDDSYLQKAVDKLDEEKNADAVCLTGAPLKIRSTIATECIDIENKLQHRLLSEGKIKPFYAWVFRRHALMSIGGFDERLFQGEDKDVFRRFEGAGHSVAWVPGVNWRHVRDQTTWELAKKWFVRGRSRVLYSMKHRLLSDLGKRLLPLWLLIAGILLLPFFPIIGAILIVFVLLAIVFYSLRTIVLTWPLVAERRFYLVYPLFVMVRNLTMALGYSTALFLMVLRRAQGRKIAWDTV